MLLVPTISTLQELNMFEQQNIQEAISYYHAKKLSVNQFTTQIFMKKIHSTMFGNVWTWAGTYRNTNKNIGINWEQVPITLHILLQDVTYWIDHKTYPPDEIALRFKHRLVSIHCFPNGNGRHSRLAADLLVSNVMGGNVFTWGALKHATANEQRHQYISAVRAADHGDMLPLMTFARS